MAVAAGRVGAQGRLQCSARGCFSVITGPGGGAPEMPPWEPSLAPPLRGAAMAAGDSVYQTPAVVLDARLPTIYWGGIRGVCGLRDSVLRVCVTNNTLGKH